MAYSQTFNLVVGDNLPTLTVTLKDSNSAASGATLDQEDSSTWSAVDISDATVTMRIREIGSSVISSSLTMVVTNGSAGIVTTNFPDGVLSAAGVFEAEIEILYSNGAKQTVPDLLKLKVRDDFD